MTDGGENGGPIFRTAVLEYALNFIFSIIIILTWTGDVVVGVVALGRVISNECGCILGAETPRYKNRVCAHCALIICSVQRACAHCALIISDTNIVM